MKKNYWIRVYVWNVVPMLADNEYIAYIYIRKCFKGINNIYVCICIIHLYNEVMNMYNLLILKFLKIFKSFEMFRPWEFVLIQKLKAIHYIYFLVSTNPYSKFIIDTLKFVQIQNNSRVIYIMLHCCRYY